jgi:hypothetical protein
MHIMLKLYKAPFSESQKYTSLHQLQPHLPLRHRHRHLIQTLNMHSAIHLLRRGIESGSSGVLAIPYQAAGVFVHVPEAGYAYDRTGVCEAAEAV